MNIEQKQLELLNASVKVCLKNDGKGVYKASYEGWNQDHAKALDGAFGIVTEVKDDPIQEYREKHLRKVNLGCKCLVVFDKSIPNPNNPNINITSFHFNEKELQIIY